MAKRAPCAGNLQIVVKAVELVVLVDRFPVEHQVFEHLAAEFGWAFRKADGLHRLDELTVDHSLAVVVFSPKHLGVPWEEALHAVVDVAPRALPILCQTFAEQIDWPQAAQA